MREIREGKLSYAKEILKKYYDFIEEIEEYRANGRLDNEDADNHIRKLQISIDELERDIARAEAKEAGELNE